MAHKLKTNKISTNTQNIRNKRRKLNVSEVGGCSIYGNVKQGLIDQVDDNSLEEDTIYGDSNDLLIEQNIGGSGTNGTMETYNNSNVYRRKVYPIENRCYVCPKDFAQQKDLVRHAQRFHPNDKAFKCRHCSTLFSKLKSLSTHFKRCHAHLAKTISCDYCYKSFFAQFQLERHRKTHTEHNDNSELIPTKDKTEKIIKKIKIVEPNDDIYQNRKGKIYPIQKKCAICNMTFSFQKILIKHCQQAHPNDKAFKCLYCPTVFSKLKSVTTHYKRSHSKSTKTIFCEYCNMSFYTKFLLERHLRSHTEKRPFHCGLCDKSYKYKRNLDVHMRTHANKKKSSLHKAIDDDDVVDDEYCDNEEEEEGNDEYGENGDDEQECREDDYTETDDFMVNTENSLDDDEICEDNDLLIEHNKDSENSGMETNYSYEENKRKVYPIENVCYVCPKHFPRQEDLLRHVKLFHPNDKAFKCRYCPTLFSKLKSLSNHFKRSHAHLADTFSCEYCNKSFFAEFQLKRHRQTHTECNNAMESMHKEKGSSTTNIADDEIYGNRKRNIDRIENKCSICNKKFYLQKELEKHCQQFHDIYAKNNDEDLLTEDEYYDSDEPHMFAEDEYYENDDESGDEYCDNVNKEGNNFNSTLQTKPTSNLNTNQKNHQKNNEPSAEIITIDDDDDVVGGSKTEHDSSSNIYKNTYFIIDEFNTDTEQDEEYTTADYSNDNVDKDYASGDIVSVETDQHECGVCMKVFRCQQSVARHLHRYHPEIEFFKCPYCDDNFYGLDLLADHIKLKKHTQKPNVCKYCLKSFDRRTDLNRHERIHTDERPYSCNECNTAFKQVNHLKRHKESMHGSQFQPQKFNCEVCTKSFSDPEILKRHMIIHENKKSSYPCSMCSKIFKTRYDWQRHEQTHSSRMNLICEYCLKSFNNNEILNRHVKVHKGEFKFLCTICKKTFRRKSHLVNHHKSHKKS